MITGVTFFMVLIIGFWLLNIKNIFQLDPAKVSKNNFNWTEMKKELNDIIIGAKTNIEEIKNLQQTASSSLPQTNQVEEKNIGLLKEHLMEKVRN